MQLHALHTLHTVRTGRHDEKSLPDLPSPTLTNPDHILPTAELLALPTPHLVRRPPSPSYLWNSSAEDLTRDWPTRVQPDKGRPRRTMLGEKSSSNGLRASGRGLGIKSKASNNSMRNGSNAATSPVLQDGDRVAWKRSPRSEHLQLPRRRGSGGSSGSDLSGMSTFLAKYKTDDSDDETIDGGDIPVRDDFSETEEMSAQRKKQAQEEYNSAVLSTRAERILANAKARLNVMEGNLRGARDLVAPLTAANLKRATSFGTATYSPSLGSRARYVPREFEPTPSQTLHPTNSSPHMGRDYQGHTRGFSETVLPGRSFSAQEHVRADRTNSTLQHSNGSPPERTRLKTPEPSPARQLRGSKSYDSIGSGVGYGVGYSAGRDRPLHSRSSPTSHLETLPEADEKRRSQHGRYSSHGSNNGLGLRSPPRSASRALELQDQLASLKSKMSTLKERAKEDSLKRQTQGTRSSPFNNARTTPPELFYTSSPAYGDAGLDADADVGSATSPQTPLSDAPSWEFGVAGSRNAFAEQAAAEKHLVQQARVVEIVAGSSPVGGFRVMRPRDMQSTPTPSPPRNRPPPSMHKRTPSGTSVPSPARNRFGFHHSTSSKSSVVSSKGRLGTSSDDSGTATPPRSTSARVLRTPRAIIPQIDKSVDDDYASSEADSSIYEDAPSSQTPPDPLVKHEDREDAFDYEHFFLTSALGSYNATRQRSASSSSSVSTVSTVATARGPGINGDSRSRKSGLSLFPPPTPQTPERLRAIERDLGLSHRASSTSVSTMNTFATADEALSEEEFGERAVSPISESETGEESQWDSHDVSPITPQASRYGSRTSYFTADGTSPSVTRTLSQQRARYSSLEGWMGSSLPQQQQLARETSHPSSAVRMAPIGRDEMSDRADSGVGMTKTSPNTTVLKSAPVFAKRSPIETTDTKLSAPMSTQPATSRHDPAARAVAALLDPAGRQLGLRDTAVLFGVVESLRKVVLALQEGEEGAYEGKEMRRRLDGARGWLDGRRE